MQELEARIKDLENTQSFKASQDAIQQEQMEMLITLRKIRDALMNGDSNVSSAQDVKEMEALRKENEELKKKNSKNEYRIKHLIRSIEEYQNK